MSRPSSKAGLIQKLQEELLDVERQLRDIEQLSGVAPLPDHVFGPAPPLHKGKSPYAVHNTVVGPAGRTSSSGTGGSTAASGSSSSGGTRRTGKRSGKGGRAARASHPVGLSSSTSRSRSEASLAASGPASNSSTGPRKTRRRKRRARASATTSGTATPATSASYPHDQGTRDGSQSPTAEDVPPPPSRRPGSASGRHNGPATSSGSSTTAASTTRKRRTRRVRTAEGGRKSAQRSPVRVSHLDNMNEQELEAHLQAQLSKQMGNSQSFRARPVPNSSRSRRNLNSTSGSHAPVDADHDPKWGNDGYLGRVEQLTAGEIKHLYAQEPFFAQAVKEADGLELQQLLPQPKADFQANMARDHRRRPLTPEALNRHYEHTNTKRLEDLRSILRACALSAKAEASRARHAEEVMQNIKAAVESEQQRQARVDRNAARIKTVLAQENALLEKRRAEFEAKQQVMAEREQRVSLSRKASMRAAKARAAEKERQLERARQLKKKREALRVEEMKRKLAEKEEKAAALLAQHKAAEELKRSQASDREAYRQRVKEDAQRKLEARSREVAEKAARKEQLIAEQRRAHMKELEARKEEAWLRHQDKMDNVERIKRQQDHDRDKLRRKLEAKEEKFKSMKDLQQALLDERSADRKRQIIEKHQHEATHVAERNRLPGPGEYDVKAPFDQPQSAGFTMSKYTPKSDLDWILQRAAQVPGPDAYQDTQFKSKAPSASFGKGVVPSDLEWKIIRSKETPGAGAYDVGTKFTPDTPSFSMGNFKPKSDLEWKILRAAEVPGPGAYDVGSKIMAKPRSIKELRKAILKNGGSVEDVGFAPDGTGSSYGSSRSRPGSRPGSRRRRAGSSKGSTRQTSGGDTSASTTATSTTTTRTKTVTINVSRDEVSASGQELGGGGGRGSDDESEEAEEGKHSS